MGLSEDNRTISTTPRGLVRLVLFWLIFFMVPLIVWLQGRGTVAFEGGDLPLWRAWLLGEASWIIALSWTCRGVARIYRTHTGQGPRDDRFQYDHFRGYDIEFWSTFVCYVAGILVASQLYGPARLVTPGVFAITLMLTIAGATALSRLVAPIVFRAVLRRG